MEPVAPDAASAVLLLGAGFSAPAGVPTTSAMIEGFRAKIAESDAVELFDAIVEQLEQKDVEGLLEDLEALANPPASIRRWYAPRDDELFAPQFARDLRDQLRGYIREVCMPSSAAITPLEGLWRLWPQGSRMRIYSFNYDTCVELLAVTQGQQLTDGFSPYWHPELLEDDGDAKTVRLFKVHGSVTWYRSGEHIVSLPVREPQGEFLDGSPLEPVLLYPGAKDSTYARPYEELYSAFREGLRSTRLMIAIGYSFRDADVRYMVGDWLDHGGFMVLVNKDVDLIRNWAMQYGPRIIGYATDTGAFLSHAGHIKGGLLSTLARGLAGYTQYLVGIADVPDNLDSNVVGHFAYYIRIGLYEQALGLYLATRGKSVQVAKIAQNAEMFDLAQLVIYCLWRGSPDLATELYQEYFSEAWDALKVCLNGRWVDGPAWNANNNSDEGHLRNLVKYTPWLSALEVLEKARPALLLLGGGPPRRNLMPDAVERVAQYAEELRAYGIDARQKDGDEDMFYIGRAIREILQRTLQ